MVEGSDSRRSPAPTTFLGRLAAALRPVPVAGVTAREAHGKRSGVTFLDVREASEWRSGHIPGAVHIPLGQLARRLGELDAGRPVVVVCRSGNRSAAGARVLARAGFEVENLRGGMLAWAGAGLPLKVRR